MGVHDLGLPLIISDYAPFSNKAGSIRLKLVRKSFGVDLKRSDLPIITDIYKTWRDTVELLPLRLVYQDQKVLYVPDLNTTTDKYCEYLDNNHIKFSRYLDFVWVDCEKSVWSIKKCCKRGNDVYTKILKQKFEPLINSNAHKTFFSTVLNTDRKRVRKTKMLYVTGTCDHEITGSISASWVSFGGYWNSFVTNLRNQFGKIDYIRTWQSQENGYPHFHALIYFHNYEFTTMYWKPDKTWRVHNRQMKNKIPVRTRIKLAWKGGSLDIKCVDNSKKAFKDLLKYVTRDLEGGESDLTNTMVWYYGKQSFAISKKFMGLFTNKTFAEPANADLINSEGVIQSSNSNLELLRIDVFPILKREMLPIFTQSTINNYEDPPDPPPEVVTFLEYYTLGCKPVRSKVNDKGVEVVVYEWEDV